MDLIYKRTQQERETAREREKETARERERERERESKQPNTFDVKH